MTCEPSPAATWTQQVHPNLCGWRGRRQKPAVLGPQSAAAGLRGCPHCVASGRFAVSIQVAAAP